MSISPKLQLPKRSTAKNLYPIKIKRPMIALIFPDPKHKRQQMKSCDRALLFFLDRGPSSPKLLHEHERGHTYTYTGNSYIILKSKEQIPMCTYMVNKTKKRAH